MFEAYGGGEVGIGVQGERRCRPLLSGVVGDKGVWSTKMNYEPSPKFNLFKPFKYEQSKFYFWGISYVNGKKQMRVAGYNADMHLAGCGGTWT